MIQLSFQSYLLNISDTCYTTLLVDLEAHFKAAQTRRSKTLLAGLSSGKGVSIKDNYLKLHCLF